MDNSVDKYDYHLPRELIAQEPLKQRADARLMVVDRDGETLDHCHVRDLPQLLDQGDQLVLNDTRVLRARLVGYRNDTGGKWQGLYLSCDDHGLWQILSKTRGKIKVGGTVTLLDRSARESSQLRIVARQGDGRWIVRPDPYEDVTRVLERVGRVPLPHYIRGGEMYEADLEAYQTVYARNPGSVAAPTAGLHFTDELLRDLTKSGKGVNWVTLHVGLDTFRPITANSLQSHSMHSEWADLPRSTVDSLVASRANNRRIVAVGTTTVRVLETAAARGQLASWTGTTKLFIHPPYEFRAVDALMTNFHLPRTTLLVMVRTFGGDALIRRAYEEAVREEYRFYSYGDAMLIR